MKVPSAPRALPWSTRRRLARHLAGPAAVLAVASVLAACGSSSGSGDTLARVQKSKSVSAPFGGVAHSGLGREGGHAGIEEYLEPKTMTFAL